MEKHEVTLFQTYFALVWWNESIKSKFFASEFFKGMEFCDQFVKKSLLDPGVAEGALLLPSLYVALVVPRETIFQEHKSIFDRIDAEFHKKIDIIENDYPGGVVRVTRHLRNATAHSSIYIEGGYLVFSDADRKNNYKLKARISLLDAGLLVSELQQMIYAHVKLVQSRVGDTPD